MSSSASSVFGEAGKVVDTSVVQRASSVATAMGYHRLSRWLEASGPLLRLAATSEEASSIVHAYRVTRDIIASPEAGGIAGIAAVAYLKQLEAMESLLKRPGMTPELVEAVTLELRRSNVLFREAPLATKRVVAGVTQRVTQSEASEALLALWTKNMRTLDRAPGAHAAFDMLVTRMPASSGGWYTIADLALDRAKRVRSKVPGLTRANYLQSARGRTLVEKTYYVHGKGEVFEQFARHDPEVIARVEGEMRAAWPRAAARGPDWRPIHSQTELRLTMVGNDGLVGRGLKGPDASILVAADLDPAKLAELGASSANLRVQGVAQATALFEFKAEKLYSEIGEQQTRALPRMIEGWDAGKPVFATTTILDSNGKLVEATWLLQPPDSYAGLRYFGVGNQDSIIKELPSLATAGADVENLNLPVLNDDLGALWLELFWDAFESLKT